MRSQIRAFLKENLKDLRTPERCGQSRPTPSLSLERWVGGDASNGARRHEKTDGFHRLEEITSSSGDVNFGGLKEYR